MKAISKVVAAVAAAALCVSAMAMVGCSGGASSSASSSANSSASSAASSQASSATSGVREFTDEELLTGKHTVELKVAGYDPITIQLDADAAPQTVANFAELVKEGYYDGKTFYRIVDDFCLQGGTLGNNASGIDPSLEPIKGEFMQNGVDNALADDFGRGTVAMARTSMPNSATSTFFVTLGDGSQVGPSLNGQYAAFGTIDGAGMATIDAIVADYLANVDDAQMGAISDESKQPVIESITWVE